MDTTRLFRVVIESRVFKSEAEIETLQRVNDITSDANIAVMAACKPGMYGERCSRVGVGQGFKVHVW